VVEDLNGKKILRTVAVVGQILYIWLPLARVSSGDRRCLAGNCSARADPENAAELATPAQG